MPKALERELKRKAAKKFPKDEERQDAYVYGTLRKTGWKPSREKGEESKERHGGGPDHIGRMSGMNPKPKAL